MVCNVSHNNWTTTLEQNLILTKKKGYGWVAEMTIDDFPEQATKQEAVLKMADWMHRLSSELLKFDISTLLSRFEMIKP